MNNAIEKIQNITNKGQITLPISWRRRFNTSKILLKTKGDLVEILPFRLIKEDGLQEYTVFDAIRDNRGKGLKASDLLKILRKIDV